jgi:hypothetical protein
MLQLPLSLWRNRQIFPAYPTRDDQMSDKLSVSIWGANISAEGWIAILAAVAIVGVLAYVVMAGT